MYAKRIPLVVSMKNAKISPDFAKFAFRDKIIPA